MPSKMGLQRPGPHSQDRRLCLALESLACLDRYSKYVQSLQYAPRALPGPLCPGLLCCRCSALQAGFDLLISTAAFILRFKGFNQANLEPARYPPVSRCACALCLSL